VPQLQSQILRDIKVSAQNDSTLYPAGLEHARNQAPVDQALKQPPPLALTFIDCYKMILWINL
jgi:hypothetical protein